MSYQAQGERNFHIFYQLVAGASHQWKTEMKLNSATSYHYLSQSGVTSITGVDDSAVCVSLLEKCIESG